MSEQDIFYDERPYLGRGVEMWTRGQWYAAIISQVVPNTKDGRIHCTMFHPISGALPYQSVPYWDDASPEVNRPNVWRFNTTETDVDED